MKKAIIIIVSLLVVLGGTFTALWFFTPVFNFLKPTSENFSLQAKKLFGAKEHTSYQDYIATIEKLKVKPESYTSNANISMNVSLPSSVLDRNTQKLLNSSSIKFNGSYDADSKATSSNLKLLYDNKEMLDLDTIVNGKSVSIKSKDFYDKALTMDFSKFKEFCQKNNISISEEQIESIEKSLESIQSEDTNNFVYDLLYLTEDEYKSLDKNYGDILTSIVDEDKYQSEKNKEIKVAGKDVKTTAYTLTLSGKDAYNYLLKLSELAKDDGNLKSILVKKINMLQKYTSTLTSGLESNEISPSMSRSVDSILTTPSGATTRAVTPKSSSILTKTLEENDIEEAIKEIISAIKDSEELFNNFDYSIKFTIYSDKKSEPVRFDVAIAKGKDDKGTVVLKKEMADGKDIYTIDVQKLAKKLSNSSDDSKLETIPEIIIVDEYKKTDTSRKGKLTLSMEVSDEKQEIMVVEYDKVNSKSELKNNIKISSDLLKNMAIELKLEYTGLDKDKMDFVMNVNASVPVGYSTYKVGFDMNGTTEYGKSNVEKLNSSNSVDLFSEDMPTLINVVNDIVKNAADVLPSRLSNYGIRVTKEEILSIMSAMNDKANAEDASQEDVTEPAA